MMYITVRVHSIIIMAFFQLASAKRHHLSQRICNQTLAIVMLLWATHCSTVHKAAFWKNPFV